VVKASWITAPEASRIRNETVASNTSAFPDIVTGLVTDAPDTGSETTMAGALPGSFV